MIGDRDVSSDDVTKIGALLVALSILSVDGFGKTKDKKQSPKGTPVLHERPPTFRRAIFILVQEDRAAPRSSTANFLKEEKGGYSKKFRARDAAGQEWVAKNLARKRNRKLRRSACCGVSVI